MIGQLKSIFLSLYAILKNQKKMYSFGNNSNVWIEIEETISKEHKFEYKEFSNIKKIGSGGFGEVYCANWKNSGQCVALKSFLNINVVTVKEVVREVIAKTIWISFILIMKLFIYLVNFEFIILA